MDVNNDYYLQRKKRLVSDFEKMLVFVKKVLLAQDGATFAKYACDKMRLEFNDLLPHIPYIGGDNCELTRPLVASVNMLAVYLALKKLNLDLQIIGAITLDAAKLQINSTSLQKKIKNSLKWRFLFSKYGKLAMEKAAAKSQLKAYPDGFVYKYVEGDGKNFDFGWDFTECAVCKFFHQYAADEFTPYVCQVDFLISDAVKSGLKRTSTLAEGAPLCDFRFKK